MKKFMPIIYVIAFVIGIIFIVTADTGLITSYYPALIAGIIIRCFAGVFLAIYLYVWHSAVCKNSTKRNNERCLTTSSL